MTKEEFLTGLAQALEGLPTSLLRENLEYYSSYIDEECGKGKTEEEVTSELGAPSWIANSILEAAAGDTHADETETVFEDGSGRREFSDASDEGFRGTGFFHLPFGKGGRGSLEWKGWMMALLGILIFLLILCVIGMILGVFFRILFAVLMSPVFWILLAALAVYIFIRQRRG